MTTITVDTDGTSGDYSSLSAAVAALPDPLTDDYTITCAASTGVADTAQVTVSVTLNGFELSIQAATGHSASTSWDSGRYRLSYSSAGYALSIQTPLVLDGMQIENSASNGSCVEIQSGGNGSTVLGCFFDGHSNSGNGIQAVADSHNIVNCIAVRCAWAGIRSTPSGSPGAGVVYNCTAINCGDGIMVSQYRVTRLTNCYAGGNTTDYNCGVNRDPIWTTCYSEDGTGTTTTTTHSTSAGTYFTNITPGTEDVSLGASSSLRDTGTDLSADADYAFSTDILGTTRSGTWDIGADEYVAAGGTDTLTGADLTGGTPTLDGPTIGQTHAITGSDLTSGTATLDSPTIGQTHVITAADLTSSAPTLDSSTIGQIHVITGADLTSGTPTLDAPTLAESLDTLTGADLTAAAPTLDAPTLGQIHILTGTDLTSGVPTIGEPLVDAVIAAGVVTATIAVRAAAATINAQTASATITARSATVTVEVQ